ncbi:Cation efflux system protein CusA [Anatilimnocola aggregata]|uniref:Cation efflux system protein CusA n=2 Tax=Anatilimnocola aggregata TaxID=2528021 RepID=A0A517Y8T6_9BACT|nr:Cation efflux system protein CusA [Anatilimnocola aggregata]
MLRAMIDFCVRQPFLTLFLALIIAAVGGYCATVVPIDAIPNVGENQVIVFTEWPGRSPKDVEDQVTYPLSVALLTVPHAESVRGKSMFGYSFVQVTFADGTDFYWARSRVLERLGTAIATLPAGVTPTLGPDATALGQIFYYVLDGPKGMNLAELRSLQDYVIKYELQSVQGVSEVASVGGYVRQYQIEVDPDALRFHDIPLDRVIAAVKDSNIDVGAKTVESGGMEYVIRGRGFIGQSKDVLQSLADIEKTVVVSRDGVPVRIRDLGQVQLGPDFRSGAIDLNGSEAVGGVVVMRFGENPRDVIQRVRDKIKQIEPGLKGVKVVAIYDRTGLINETVETLTESLREELMITAVVIVIFLLHIRASIIVAVTLPMAVLMAFIGMVWFKIDANIMSLAGIAIAIGEVADLGIIISENIYQHLVEWEASQAGGVRATDGTLQPRDARTRTEVIIDATHEVAPAVMTGVSTTIVSFLPVFFLTGRDYKLFAPLAWTKTFAMFAALLVAVFLVPALCRLLLSSARWPTWRGWVAAGAAGAVGMLASILFWHPWIEDVSPLPLWATAPLAGLLIGGMAYLMSRERLRPIEENPTSRIILWIYEPTLRFLLAHKFSFMAVPLLIILLGTGAWLGLPTILYPAEQVVHGLGAEPNAIPGYVDLKHRLPGLRTDDWIALDEGTWFYMPTLYPAASFSQGMEVLQTQDALIKEIPEVANVLGKIGRVESALDPAPGVMIETYVMLKPESEWRPGVTIHSIWEQINALGTLPGVTPASPLQPIEGRVVMLQSGIKAPMAIRVYGDNLDGLAEAARSVAERLKKIPQVNAATVNPDIVLGMPYVEFDVDREAAARFGMTTMSVNQVIETALGGMNLTTTVEGRERYPIRIRYQRDLRERIDDLPRLPVVTESGEVVPLEILAKMKTTWGPGMISSEDARLVAHIAFAPSGMTGDLETVEAVENHLRQAQTDGTLKLPAGYALLTVGSFQNQIAANRRLILIMPLVALAELLIIYLNFRSIPLTLIIFTQIPIAVFGGMIGLGLYGIEMNTAIWVGLIALIGISEDDGVVIATYMEQLFARLPVQTVQGLRNATLEAGRRRIRPCLMTAFTTFAALLPVMLATGRGADVARAMALPVFFGMFIELVSLFVVPVLYCGYMEMKLHLAPQDNAGPQLTQAASERPTMETTHV